MILKIHFTDFWPVFKPEDNFLLKLLEKHFDIVHDSVNPDVLFFSVFNVNHLKYSCPKIFFTGENIRPNFNECDFSISFDYDNHGGKNYRYPLYAAYEDVRKLTLPKNPQQILEEKSGFCNFVYSNADSPKRNNFFKLLSKYKKVDSGGRVYNNIGQRVPNKLEFIKKYKFTIAFENESYPGYTTEKIFEPMLVNSIPIYWGNPEIHKDFNTASFISYHDFKNEQELIDYIIEVDNNDELYLQILEQPYFKDNCVNEFVDEAKFNTWLKKTLDLCLDKSKERNGILLIKPKKSKVYFTLKKIQYWTKWTIRISKTISILKIRIKFKKWISG